MPDDIRDKYQYFTEANMNKLEAAGYTEKFYSLGRRRGRLCKELSFKNEFLLKII